MGAVGMTMDLTVTWPIGHTVDAEGRSTAVTRSVSGRGRAELVSLTRQTPAGGDQLNPMGSDASVMISVPLSMLDSVNPAMQVTVAGDVPAAGEWEVVEWVRTRLHWRISGRRRAVS